MTDRDHLFLAYNQRTYGALSDAWLSPRLQRYSLHDPAYWASVGQLAERGLIDIVFSGDASAHANPTEGIAHDGLDRFTAWSALLEATEHPGFILTASTTYNDPFRLAERLLSLDHLSGGRLAWNVVTSHSQAAAANFGLDAHPDRTLRYARGEEFVGLVVDLWNSAITGEKVDHVSDQFHVQGRLSVPPSAQGRPPIIRASTSRDGADLQGRYANGVFAADLSRAAAVANRAQVRHDATRFGRPADDLTYLSGLRIVLGATEEEAQRKVGGGHAQTPERIAQQLDWFGRLIDHDLTTLDPDQPLPAELISETRVAALPETGTTHGFRASVLGLVHDHLELPLRELITQLTFVGSGHSTYIGTPEG
ncbi:LLM class flavin-dependent oxidoreductase, partial [Pseudactinotalea sp.]|uniref:LLM class flavin-dependent oxidoreductase n=1 Tax=Pseudactinotalea sp. TaxID=1926260 RepID=UPI003B3A639E